MNKFTVVLAYPDYMESDYGTEYYSAQIEAETVSAAVELARKEAGDLNDFTGYFEDEYYGDVNDFRVVAVFAGFPELLAVGEE